MAGRDGDRRARFFVEKSSLTGGLAGVGLGEAAQDLVAARGRGIQRLFHRLLARQCGFDLGLPLGADLDHAAQTDAAGEFRRLGPGQRLHRDVAVDERLFGVEAFGLQRLIGRLGDRM